MTFSKSRNVSKPRLINALVNFLIGWLQFFSLNNWCIAFVSAVFFNNVTIRSSKVVSSSSSEDELSSEVSEDDVDKFSSEEKMVGLSPVRDLLLGEGEDDAVFGCA